MIHGVLPLNLHLDVCLTAIDLLMKGGEHFPAALLRRLAAEESWRAGLATQDETASEGVDPERGKGFGHGRPHDTRNPDPRSHLHGHAEQDHRRSPSDCPKNTVKVHVRNIYKKMNVRNRTEAASRYFRTTEGLGPSRTPSPTRWRN